MSGKPTIVYWNGIPAPYIEQRFNALSDCSTFDFEAWFSARTEAGRNWAVDESKWRFRYRYLPGLRLGRRRLSIPTSLISGTAPDLLVSLYASPSFVLGWWLARSRGVRTAFPAEITFDSWVHRRRWKEVIKGYMFHHVDGIITFGSDSGRTVRRYGVSPNRIHYVVNSIDVDRFAEGSSRAQASPEAIREKLALRGPTFLYVGRLWKGKGVDFLLDAFGKLQSQWTEEISLLVVGDGPERERLERKSRSEHLRNVIFTGFQRDGYLPSLYAAADVFVFPTLGDPYGLVVDEAMACSLPVISTTAAGEIRQRIDDGVNGFTVPPGDADALFNRMRDLVADKFLRARMGQASAAKMIGHTPEQWAQDFEQAVTRMLAMPRAGLQQ
jgi:glycosyltransferase involved in cell wall biosynthesis